MSLVIAVGLSVHHVSKWFVKQLVAARTLTFGQEMTLRSAYPAVVMFLLWNMKSALSSK